MFLIETEEQSLLRDMLRRYFREGRFGAEPGGTVLTRDDWSGLAELGLPGLLLEERWGGSGCGAQELAITASEMGRALISAPFAGTVAAAGLIQKFASEEQKQRLLPEIANGGIVPLFIDARDGSLSLDQDGQVSGARDVECGMDVDLIVAAVQAGDGDQRVVLIEHLADAIAQRAVDDRPGISAITLHSARTEALASGSAAAAGLAETDDLVSLARLADIVGAMDGMFRLTVEHVKTREQFGKPLAQFQVLQHRTAEMFTELEMARSMLLNLVAHTARGHDALRRRHAAASAHLRILTALDRIGPEAIQMHGGMGMAWEHRVGHLVRRAIANGLRMGSDSAALDNLGHLPAFHLV